MAVSDQALRVALREEILVIIGRYDQEADEEYLEQEADEIVNTVLMKRSLIGFSQALEIAEMASKWQRNFQRR